VTDESQCGALTFSSMISQISLVR